MQISISIETTFSKWQGFENLTNFINDFLTYIFTLNYLKNAPKKLRLINSKLLKYHVFWKTNNRVAPYIFKISLIILDGPVSKQNNNRLSNLHLSFCKVRQIECSWQLRMQGELNVCLPLKLPQKLNWPDKLQSKVSSVLKTLVFII